MFFPASTKEIFLMKNPLDNFFLPTLSASKDRKPKWERKSRAVWNSCEGGGGLQSVCGSGKRLDFQISSLCRSKAFSYSICLVIRIRSLSCWTSSCEEEVNGGGFFLIGCGWSVVDDCINSASTLKGEVPKSKSWGVTSQSWCEKESLMCICAVKHWYQTWGWVPFYWLNLYTLIQSSTKALQ